MKKRFTCIAILSMVLLFQSFNPGFAQNKKEKEVPKGSISVKVAYPDGKVADGARLTVGGKEYVTDKDGSLFVDGIEEGEVIVSSEKYLKKGGFLGLFARKIRYAGFDWTSITGGETTESAVTISEVSDMNALCFSCHPQRRTRKLPIIKCLHRSGEVLPEKMSKRVKIYNENIDKLEKEGKPHGMKIKLEMREIDDKEVEFFTCESCHTFHVKTKYRRYAVAEYFNRSDLCLACHY